MAKIIDVLQKTGYHVIMRTHPKPFKSEKELIDTCLEDSKNKQGRIKDDIWEKATG